MPTEIKSGAELKINGANIEGYLIQFGSEAERDLDGQFFTPRTFYGYATELPVFYHHGFNNETQKTLLGKVSIRKDGKGIFCSGTLTADAIKDFFEDEVQKAERYAAMIRELGLKSKLGWSSGTAGHTLRIADTGEIRQWVLCEASLTPTPADWRNDAVFKSIVTEHIGLETQETGTPSESVKVGTEISNANRDAMQKAHAKYQKGLDLINEAHTEFGSFIAAKQPQEGIVPIIPAPSKALTTMQKLNNYLKKG